MTTVHFQIGVKRTPRVLTPPSVPPQEPQWQTLAEEDMELDDTKLAELATGFLEIAFPVRALQGRVGPQDAIAVRVGLPGHTLVDHDQLTRAAQDVVDADLEYVRQLRSGDDAHLKFADSNRTRAISRLGQQLNPEEERDD